MSIGIMVKSMASERLLEETERSGKDLTKVTPGRKFAID